MPCFQHLAQLALEFVFVRIRLKTKMSKNSTCLICKIWLNCVLIRFCSDLVATASQQDAQLFAALARVAELHLGDFNVQHLANIAWAFAMAAQSDAELFRALARSAGQCVGDFHAQDLANTAWAFATLGQPDVKLFAVL